MDPTLNSSFFSIFEFALHSTVISIILIPTAEGGTEMPEIYFEQHLIKIPQIASANNEKQELYLLLQKGFTDVVQGNSRPFTEAMDTLRNHRKKQNRGAMNG